MTNQWICAVKASEDQETPLANPLLQEKVDDFAYAVVMSNTQVTMELLASIKRQAQQASSIQTWTPPAQVQVDQPTTLNTLDWLERQAGTKRPSRASESSSNKRRRLD